MEAYLDNSATTRCSEEAAKEMQRVLLSDYGNPSSLHGMGVAAEQYLKKTRRVIAESLKASEKEIIFTSGGTEANNLALRGAAEANRRNGRHIITTPIEHPSVEQPLQALSENGFEITHLSVDAKGRVSAEELSAAVREDTVLVSIMQVNNEIGTVQPVEALSEVIKNKNPKTLFHVDAIQGYGKVPLFPSRAGIDLMSVSGHKFHAPKGSGFLYVREKMRLSPQNLGGGQEGNARSGTENVPAIAGLGVAVEELFTDQEAHRAALRALRERTLEGLRRIDGVQVNGAQGEESAPHIVSVSVKDVRAEVLLHALEERGIYVSAGSACSSNKPALSRTLQAISLPRPLLDKTIRLSFSIYTTEAEIDYALAAMQEVIPKLRRFTRH